MISAIAMLAASSSPAFADSLMNRLVTFQVLTYDSPESPVFNGHTHVTVVRDGPEFGLLPEGSQNELDVIPVIIDIDATSLWISFETAGEGAFWQAEFNGYVLSFERHNNNCIRFTDARLDTSETTLTLDDDAITFDNLSLRINVAGMSYQPSDRILVHLETSGCATS